VSPPSLGSKAGTILVEIRQQLPPGPVLVQEKVTSIERFQLHCPQASGESDQAMMLGLLILKRARQKLPSHEDGNRSMMIDAGELTASSSGALLV